MSKWSEEFEKQYPTIGDIKKETKCQGCGYTKEECMCSDNPEER